MSTSNSTEINYNDVEIVKIYENTVAQCPERQIVFEMTLKYFGNVSGKSVIDFGRRPGFFLKICSDHGANLINGVDSSTTMVKRAIVNVHLAR